MMERQNDYLEDFIDRYIYQVMKSLPSKNSKDIEEELRTLISDMLEDRSEGNSPTKEDLNQVLKELGSPYDLSQKYSDNSNYLISPAIYPTYFTIMRIVLFATALGLSVTTILGLVTGSDLYDYNFIGKLIGDIVNGLLAAFGWVTIIFALIERKGITLKNTAADWDPASLPPTPIREIAIPIWKPVTSMVLTIVFIILFAFTPQLMGAYHLSDHTKVIPIFDLKVLRTVLPLILICFGLGFVKHIWEFIEKKIIMKYAVLTIVIDLIQMGMITFILTQFHIWNSSFLTEENSLFHMNGNLSVAALNNRLNNIVLAIFAAIFLLDCASVFIKAIKYGNKV